MVRYRVQLCVQILFYTLISLLSIAAIYWLSMIVVDVLAMNYRDELTIVWVLVLGSEIAVAWWFLVRSIHVIGWNAQAIFGTSMNFITHFLSALA